MEDLTQHRPGQQRVLSQHAATLLILLTATLLNGCAQDRFFAHSLPAEWHARPSSNVQEVDLTRIATPTIPTNEINSGDVIEVSLAAGLTSNDTADFSLRINERGDAILPHLGPIHLSGLTLEESESAIKAAYIEGQVFRNPHVTVTMKQPKEIEVTVVGAVETEGTFRIRAGSAGLLTAISQAGGFSENAGTVVEVRLPSQSSAPSNRPGPVATLDDASPQGAMTGDGEALASHRVPVHTSGPKSYHIDLASLGQEDPGSLKLQDGAVVMVERRDPAPLHVLGLVRKPDRYEIPVGKNLRLMDAIALAGGVSSPVANKIFVIRRRPEHPEPALIEVSLRRAKKNGAENLLLEPGDTVTVEQTPSTVLLEAIRTIGFTIGGSVF